LKQASVAALFKASRPLLLSSPIPKPAYLGFQKGKR